MVINVLASDAILLLEGGLRRVTDAFCYTFIAYVSSSDVPMDTIYLYIGGKPGACLLLRELMFKALA
jgi:hypothetical protein